MIRVCGICNRRLPRGSHGLTKYCSDKCRKDAIRNQIRAKELRAKMGRGVRFCSECGEEIGPLLNLQIKYCDDCREWVESESRRLASARYYENNREMILDRARKKKALDNPKTKKFCLVCGRIFWTRYKIRKVYCSDSCRHKASNERSKLSRSTVVETKAVSL